MKNFSLSLTTKQAFDSQVSKLLSDNPSQSLYVNITDKPKKRGLPANAQQHVFYDQIAKYYDDRTPLQVKDECKFLFGLQVALSSEKLEPIVSFLIDKLNYHSYSYENQLKLMKVIVRTSDFSTKESKAYMDAIIDYYNGEGLNIRYKD